jgi:hypothetical protein
MWAHLDTTPVFVGRDAPCCFGVSRREADFPTARRDTETTGIAPNISSLVSGWQCPDAPVLVPEMFRQDFCRSNGRSRLAFAVRRVILGA